VLAPEDEDPKIDTLRLSLASDIVELVVLTADEIFLQTLREAVGPSRRLWHVPSPDKVGDLLLAGGVGILVLDAQVLDQAGTSFITQIKHQFPDLVIVVAGTRDTEIELGRKISDGSVYRFIHKPMSPARARLFADAAVRRYDEQRRRSGEMSVAAAKPAGGSGLAIAGGCALICAVAGTLWSLTREDRAPAVTGTASRSAAPMPTSGASDAALPSAESRLLARAAEAMAANRLVAPPGDNALELYLQVGARNPGSAEARAGVAAVRERLLARAENALLEERLDEAAAAIETARRAGVESGRISLLSAELAKARGDIRAADAARSGAAAGNAGPTDPAAASAALALNRIQEGRLIDPPQDSARFYVEDALKRNPDSDAAGRAGEALALALLNAARTSIDRGDLKAASAWIEAADGIASPDNVGNLRRALSAAEHANPAASPSPPPPSPSPSRSPQSAIESASATGAAATAPTAGVSAAGTASSGVSAETSTIDAAGLALVKSVQPDYPRKAREAAIEGWVELEFTVTPSGLVNELAVTASNPRGVFDQAALTALSQWRYKPVMVGAKAVPQRARLRIRFTLTR
jgi:TonB family protein